MSESNNTNRDLSAEQVIHLFKKNLPKLLSGIAADREWLWWAGDKQDDPTRKLMGELGWRFSGKPHRLADGRSAHWYHACGGKIVFRRKGGHHAADAAKGETPKGTKAKASTTSTAERKPAERVNPAPAASGALSNLLRFSQNLE